MTRDGRESPEVEHCLRSLERLMAQEDEALASLSLDLYGERLERELGPEQAKRLDAVKARLAELREASSEVPPPVGMGVH